MARLGYVATASIEHRPSGARVRCIGCDPKRAHGLAPALVLADEPSQWERTKSEAMLAALRTAMGKIAGARMIALGTRPDSRDHWFSRMLESADYAQLHAAGENDDPFLKATWRSANPSLKYLPALEARIRKESLEAKADESHLSEFRALRLNLGVSDTLQSTLLDAATWKRIESTEGVERRGRWALGLDLGTSAAMSAAAGYWPTTGALEAVACFPELPALRERGLADGVGNLYERMVERDELIVAGRRVSDVSALLAEVRQRWGSRT